MNIQQIANQIDQNGWAFTLYQTKPSQVRLLHHVFDLENTAEKITELVKLHDCEEIQIVPEKRNGSTFKQGFAKTITINFKKSEMKEDINSPAPAPNNEIEQLLGLGKYGLNIAEIFTAKDKANELERVREQNRALEQEKQTMTREIMQLENKLLVADIKKANNNEIVNALKNPALLKIVGSMVTKTPVSAPVEALGTPVKEDPKMTYLNNLLTSEKSPESLKDLLIHICKAQSSEKGADVINEIIEVLVKNDILKTAKQ